MLRRLLTAALFIVAVVSLPSVHERYLYWNTGKAVVVLNPLFNFKRGGSGFQILTAEGPRVITNAHLCEGRPAMLARNLWNAERVDILKVLKVDREKDLCMLEGVPGLGVLRPAFFAPSVLDEIFVVGHPDLELTTISRGRVRGEIQVQLEYKAGGKYMDSISISAKVYRGNSGSPVVNSFGGVVGVLLAVTNRTDNGYFVPLRHLKSFIGRR